MLIIERQATANHTEYRPILALMGLFRRNGASKVGQNRRLGASWGRRLGAKPPLAPNKSPARPQGAIFMRPGGPNGWRYPYSFTFTPRPWTWKCGKKEDKVNKSNSNAPFQT